MVLLVLVVVCYLRPWCAHGAAGAGGGLLSAPVVCPWCARGGAGAPVPLLSVPLLSVLLLSVVLLSVVLLSVVLSVVVCALGPQNVHPARKKIFLPSNSAASEWQIYYFPA